MPLTCPRCSRVNPVNAVFCHNDGASLGAPGQHRAVLDPARQRFPRPFVFPSGHPCHSFDELVLACFNDWKAACELLKDGSFAAFLAGLGRADLARAAREAARQADPDNALDGLINRLPSSVLQPPALQAEPSQFNLGEMRPGKDWLLNLRLENAGLGLLTGSADCSATPWLFFGFPGAASKKKVFQFLHDHTLPLFVQGKALQASKNPLDGKIVLDTSGGQLVVPVALTVPVLPFPHGALSGCTSPRQVAEKALSHQREAGELFASGAVAAWYASNGWSYPVKEPAATGVAAVQQFFEALGLSRPVKVAIDRKEITLEAWPGQPASDVITLTTDEKRPIWAHVECSAPWLDVREVALDKKKVATIKLGAARVPDQPGEVLQARATLTTNGRVRHVINVRLKVKGRKREEAIAEVIPMIGLPPVSVPEAPPPRPSPVMERHDRPPPVRRRTTRDGDTGRNASQGGGAGRALTAAIPVLLTLLGLSITLGRDVGTWWANKAGDQIPGMEVFEGKEQVLRIAFHDQEERVTLAVGGSAKGGEGTNKRDAYWRPSMRFGLSMPPAKANAPPGRLTYDAKGLTNNCVVRIDGAEYIFGEEPFVDRMTRASAGIYPARSSRGPGREPPLGRWEQREAKLDKPLKDGRKSVWLYNEDVAVTQTVGLLLGEQTGRIDTCLVHYKIENRDTRPHRVGLRFLLDTFVGQNDGAPFLIPGQKQLCSTKMEFNSTREVPDFIQVCQENSLANPGTVAQIQFRLADYEPPTRVTLGSFPNPKLVDKMKDPRAMQEKTFWDVPVYPIETILKDNKGDSAVTMYWDEKEIKPGGTRELAFAYGLGTVSGRETGGKLALTVGGSFVPGGEFTLTAYVSKPERDESVRLTLPDGFELLEGEENASVPPVPAGAERQISPVTWRIRAGKAGTHALKATSSTGVSQTQNVRIRVRGIFGN